MTVPTDPQQPVPAHEPADVAAMRQALDEARKASARAEVPVGAVVAHAGEVIGRGHNAPVDTSDPTAHAEVVALRAAAQSRANYRLQDCTLYVTLEPCVMCAGAILNARVGRVVFGARDPKGGAAGSVINLFANRQLNPHTQVQGGILADACAALLQAFFQARRQQPDRIPLREDALRTPDAAFSGLAGYPWQPRYIRSLPDLDGLRLHYINEGPVSTTRTWLLLHGSPVWSYAYRHLIQALLDAGQHVLAVDLPGFGKSDKPKKERAHSFAWHAQVLSQFVHSRSLQRIACIGFGLGADLSCALTVLQPDQCRSAWLLPTPSASATEQPCRTMAQFLKRQAAEWTEAERQAYAAPFPNRGFEAALRVDNWNATAGWTKLRASAQPPADTMRLLVHGEATDISILPAVDAHGHHAWPTGTSSAVQAVPHVLRSTPAAQALAQSILAACNRHLPPS